MLNKLIEIVLENIDKKELDNIIINRIRNELYKFSPNKLKRVIKVGEGEFFYYNFEDIKEVLKFSEYHLNREINCFDDLERSILENNEEFGKYIFKIVNKFEEYLNILNDFFNEKFFDDNEKTIFNNIILNKKIAIKDFTFSDYKDNDYILSKIEKLEFEECIFFDDFNFIENKTYYFNNCIFENDLTISNCQTFENESLFFDCEFKKEIKIESEIINVELFENCRIKNLTAVNCSFNKKIINDTIRLKSNGIKYNELYFRDCVINEEFYLPIGIFTNTYFGDLYFSTCIFKKNVSLSLGLEVQSISISFCNFLDDLILNAPKIKSLEIKNTNFFGNVDLGRSSIEIFGLESSNFSKNCNFYNTKFIKYNDFKFTTFNQSVNFSKAKFNNINFSDTNFLSFVDFSEISNIENKQIECEKIENRKTARILKSKLDEANNIIESNYFYSIEMKKREEELEDDIKKGKNFFEWLVFKIHGLTSNHSQDWFLCLFWILSFSFGYSFMSCVNKLLDTKLEYILTDAFIYLFVIYTSILIINYKKINKFYLIGLFYIFYVYLSKDFTLQTFSNNLNPFSIMTEFSELNFSTMIYKIIIAYLIYQLIISIRQNTRRK